MSLPTKKQSSNSVNPTTNKTFEQERADLFNLAVTTGQKASTIIKTGLGDQTANRLEQNQVEALPGSSTTTLVGDMAQEASQYISTSQKEQIAKKRAIQEKKIADQQKLKELEEQEIGKEIKATLGDEETLKVLEVEKELAALSDKKSIGKPVAISTGKTTSSLPSFGVKLVGKIFDIFSDEDVKFGINKAEEAKYRELSDYKLKVIAPAMQKVHETYALKKEEALKILNKETERKQQQNAIRRAQGLAADDVLLTDAEKRQQNVIAKYDEVLEQIYDYRSGNTDFFAGLSTTSEDVFSLGLRPLLRDMDVLDVIAKKERIYKDKQAGIDTQESLSTSDEALVEAYGLAQELQNLGLHKENWWYTTGQGVGGSASFMLQMALTRNAGSFVKAGVKKAVGLEIKTGLRAGLKAMVKDRTYKGMTELALKKSLAGTAGLLAQAPLAPFTYKAYTGDQIGNVERVVDVNGKERYAVRQELYDLKKEEYEGKIAIVKQLIKAEKDPEKVAGYKDNLVGLQAEFDSYVPKSKLASAAFAVGEHFKESFSEAYAGRGAGAIAGKIGNLTGRGLRRIGGGGLLDKSSKALSYINSPFKKANRYLNNVMLGRISANQIGQKSSGGLIQSVPEEIFEEIFVQAVPSIGATKEQYQQQFEELGKLSFYRDVAAQTLIMGGAFGYVGTIGRYGGMIKDLTNYDKSLRELYKTIEDKDLNKPLTLSTGNSLASPLEYRMASAKLREQGNDAAADKVEQRMFLNLATQAARLGNLDTYQEDLAELLESDNTTASMKQNAMLISGQLEAVQKAYNEHSDKDNFGAILNAVTYIGLHTDNLQELEKQRPSLELQAKQEIDSYLTRTGKKVDYDISTLLTKEFSTPEEQAQYEDFIDTLLNPEKENSTAVQNLVSNIQLSRGIEIDIAENRKALSLELSSDKQEKIERKKALREEFEFMLEEKQNSGEDVNTTKAVNEVVDAIGEYEPFLEIVTKEDLEELREIKLKQAKANKLQKLKDIMTNQTIKIDSEKEIIEKQNKQEGDKTETIIEKLPEEDGVLEEGISSNAELDAVFGLASDFFESSNEENPFIFDGEPIIGKVYPMSFIEQMKEVTQKVATMYEESTGHRVTFKQIFKHYKEKGKAENMKRNFGAMMEAWIELNMEHGDSFYPLENFHQTFSDIYSIEGIFDLFDIDSQEGAKAIEVSTPTFTEKHPGIELREKTEEMQQKGLVSERIIGQTDSNRNITEEGKIEQTTGSRSTSNTNPKVGYSSLETKEVTVNNTFTKESIPVLDVNKGNNVNITAFIHPDGARTGDILDIEVSEEAEWKEITVSNGRDNNGKTILTTFDKWVKEREDKDSNFRNTEEFQDKLPMWYVIDGQRTGSVQDTDWYNGYNLSDPLGLGINPHNPHPEWAKEIQKGKEGTRLLRQNIKRGLREVVIHKSPTSVFYKIPESEPSITLAEANPQTIIAVQTGENISIGEKVPFTAGVILNQEAFSERDEKGKLVSDSHTWEIRRMGEQQLPNGKWVATYQAFPVLRAVTEEQVETVRWALAANAVKKDYSYTKGTKWAEMSKEQADVIRNETLKHTGLDIYIAKDLLTFVESFLQLRGRPAEMDGKVSYYQNRFLKVGIELDNNNVEFAQHSKSALLNSRSFKTAVHIVNGVVTPLNLNYSDYLKSTLKTNVKSFNIGTEADPMYITQIQPIINVTYTPMAEPVQKTEAEKVVEKVIETKEEAGLAEEVSTFDEKIHSDLAIALGLDVEIELEGEAMISNEIESVRNLLTVIAGLTTPQEQDIRDFITHTIAELRDNLAQGNTVVVDKRQYIEQEAKLKLIKKLDAINEAITKNLKLIQNETVKTPTTIAYEKAYIKALENIRNIEEQFMDIFDRAVTNYERQSKVEVEEELEREDELEGKNYSKESIEESSKLSVGTILRNFLYGVERKTSKGVVETGYLGIPKYYTFNEIFNELTKVLSVGSDLPSSFEALVQKLEASEIPFTKDILVKLKGADQQIKNQFLYTFVKHTLSSHFSMYQKVGQLSNLKSYETNANEAIRVIEKKWTNDNRSSGLYNKDLSLSIDKATEFIDRYNSFLTPEGVSTDIHREWLQDLGLTFTDATWDEIVNTGLVNNGVAYTYNNILLDDSLGIFKPIVKFLEKAKADPNNFAHTEEKNIFKDLSNKIKSLAKVEAKFNTTLISLTYRDGDKNIYTQTPPTFFTDRVDDLLAATTQEGNSLIDDLQSLSFSGNSILLDFLKNVPSFREMFKVSHAAIVTLKERGEDAGNKSGITDLGEIDYDLNINAQFGDRKLKQLPGTEKIMGIPVRLMRMLTPTMSDKSKAYYLDTVGLDLLNSQDLMSSDTGAVVMSENLKELLVEQLIMGEVRRIIKFNNNVKTTNIKEYDKGAAIFHLIPALNTLVDKDGVSILQEMRSVPNLTPELLQQKYGTQFKQIVENVIVAEAEGKKELWKEQFVEGVGSKMFSTNYFSEAKKSPVTDYEKGIYDVVINGMLHNSEMFKVFAGDMALYSQAKVYNIETKNSTAEKKEFKTISEFTTEDWVGINKTIGVNLGKRLAALAAPGSKIAGSADAKFRFYNQIFLQDSSEIAPNVEYLITLHYGKTAVTPMIKELLAKYATNLETINSYQKGSTTDMVKVEEDTKSMGDIKKQLGKIFPAISDFLNLESTDAQEYTTVREHINVLYNQGRITVAKFNAINERLDAGKHLRREDLKVILQPIKPVYTGTHIEKDFDVNRFVYIKSSSYPLLPQFTKGTKLDALRVKMEQLEAPKSAENPNGTGRFTRASFQSANKVGAAKTTINLFDKYSLEGIKEYAKGDPEAKVLVLDRNNFRIQQDVPIKSEKEKDDYISMGTQFFKLLFGDGMTKDEAGNDITGYEIDGKPMTGRELHKYYTSAFADMARIKRTELFSELGLSPNGQIVDKQQFIVNLKELLKKEAISRGYSLKSIAGLEIDKLAMMGGFFYEFKTPLWLSPDKNRYEALLNSIVGNRLMKFKIPGLSYVAGSESGVQMSEDLNSLKDFDERIQSRIIYLDNYNGKELGATSIEEEDGAPVFKKAQVFIRSYFKDPYTKKLINLFEGYNSETGDTTGAKYLIRRENGTLGLKEGMINPALMNMFSFRTPTSSHVSGSSIEIAGILPPEMGELMIVPKNFTKQKGLDFDVDKENTYQLNHIVGRDGEIKELTQDYVDKKLKGLKAQIDKYNAENVSASARSNFANELFAAYIQGTGRLLDESSLEILLLPQLSIAEKFIKLESELNLKVAENKFIKSHLAVFNNPNPTVQKKINKALSMAFSQEQAALFEKIEEQSNKEKGIQNFINLGMSPAEAEKRYMENQSYKTVLSYSYQKMKMDLGSIGKVAIGVYANYTTMNGLIQQQDANITLGEPIILGKFVSEGTLGVVHSLTPSGMSTKEWRALGMSRYTADIFAEKENTATDNEKEQILGRVGVNDQTINVDALLTMLGFDADLVVTRDKKKVPMSLPYLLLSQPSIKEYNKKIKNSEGVLGGFLNRTELKKSMIEELSEGKITFDFDPKLPIYDPKNVQTFRFVDSGAKVLSGKRLSGQALYEGMASKGTADKMVQAEALISYLDLEKKARMVSKAQGVINTNDLGKSLLESSKVYEALGKLPDSGIENVEKLLGTFAETPSEGAYKIGEYYVTPTTAQGHIVIHGLQTGNTLFGDFFPYQDNNIKEVVKEILTIQGHNVDDMANSVYIKEFHSIMEEIIRYINSNPKNNTHTGTTREKRLETFVDSDTNTSLSTYLRDISTQKTNRRGVNSVIKNALYKRFSYTTGMGEELSLIKYNNAATDNLDEEILYNSMLELALDDLPLPARNGKPYSTRLLVEDLIGYSFLEGGVQSATQFSKFIPIELLEFTGQMETNVNDRVMFVPINKKLQMYNNRNKSNTFFASVLGVNLNDVTSFTQQYFQNNPKRAKKVYKGVTFGENGELYYNNPKGANPTFINYTTKKGNELIDNLYKNVGAGVYMRIDIVGQSGIKEYSYKEQQLTSLVNKSNTVKTVAGVNTKSTLRESITIKELTTPEELLAQMEKLTFREGKQHLAEASKWLLPLLKKGKVTIKLSDKLKGIDGFTGRPNDKGEIVILLSRSQMETLSKEKGAEIVLHEVLHSVAVSHLTEYFDNSGTMLKSETFIPAHVKKLMSAYTEARNSIIEEVKELEAKIAHNKVVGNPQMAYTDREISVVYGMTNIFEFVSVSLTSEEFQEEFKDTPFMNSDKSIFDKIEEFIMSMISIMYPDLKDNTLAKEAILASMQFIQEERKDVVTVTQEKLEIPDSKVGMTYGKSTVDVKTESMFDDMTPEEFKALYGDDSGEAIISNDVNEIITTFGETIESLGISQEEWDFLSSEEQDKIKKCN